MFSDQPIKHSKKDLFGRKKFANRIAQIIANRTDKESIAIDIHAPWGEGKTSVLNMIVESLEDYLHKENKTLLDGNLVLLKFNPWRFTDENQLLENFYFALANKLEGRIKTKGENVADLVKKLAWVTSPLDAIKFGAFGIDANLKVEETLKKIAEEKSKIDITTLKERIEKILEDSDKKVIVIMDDIDRLNKEEIQAVFRLIKLSADFPNTIYLLSFDIERVSEALAEKYGSKEAGRSFLEKIIQISLPLPFLNSSNLIKLVFDNINRLLVENNITLQKRENDEWVYFFISNFSQYIKSPRLVKKYINNLWFSLPTNKDEINIYDLQTIEAIHTFLPELYEIIKNNKELFLFIPQKPNLLEKVDSQLIARLNRIIDKFSQEQKKSFEKIIQKLFPITSIAFGNKFEESDIEKRYYEWQNKKRICSPLYFERYFGFGITTYDISDSSFQEFIENIGSKNEQENSSQIKEFLSNNRDEIFLQKLSVIVETLNENQSARLAKAISLLGNSFSKQSEYNTLFELSAFDFASYLLGKLVMNISTSKQIQIAVEIASIITPLDFAKKFIEYIRSSSSHKDPWDFTGKSYKSSELYDSVRKIIVNRTKLEAKTDFLGILYSENSVFLFNLWWVEDQEVVVSYLNNYISKNPKYAEQFILSFFRQGWAVSLIAEMWGNDFITLPIKNLYPKMELLPLDGASYNPIDAMSRYKPSKDEDYLQYFLSIAELIKSFKS